ncbi:MAG: hypothetical protein LBK47_02145 [Prevotellaceae bacterium]|nr:hypothetical protein [Prevotellaceae bacterium]
MTEEKLNKEVNQWIYNTMSYYYYWEKEMPDNIENYNISPIDFFKSLLYIKDRYSFIINQSNSLGINNSISDVGNYGFESNFGYIDEDKTRIGGLVLYVFPNSMAEKEGVKRGDIFISIDEVSLTMDNIEDVFQKARATFTFIRYDGCDTTIFNKMLQRETHEIAPIYTQKIFDMKHTKIGYFCYNQFLDDNGDGSMMYVNELLECFSNFKRNGINELVVDLRYNLGGLINLSVLLASLIVPNVDSTKIALQFEYNEKIQSLIYRDKDRRTLNFSLYPDSYVGSNLNRVFFIVGSMTASASEAVINALLPYMDVILVGESTYGKNFASTLFTKTNNWGNTYAIMPVVMKVYNSSYESSYGEGFSPDYQINEFMHQLYELGDTREVILNYILTSIFMINLENENETRSAFRATTFSPLLAKSIDKYHIYEFRQHER